MRLSPPDDPPAPDTIETWAAIDAGTAWAEDMPVTVETAAGTILSAHVAGREVSRDALVAVFGEDAVTAGEVEIYHRLPDLIAAWGADEASERGDFEYHRRKEALE